MPSSCHLAEDGSHGGNLIHLQAFASLGEIQSHLQSLLVNPAEGKSHVRPHRLGERVDLKYLLEYQMPKARQGWEVLGSRAEKVIQHLLSRVGPMTGALFGLDP